jgi:NCAIR mutase (PurE)-related protein
MTKTLLSIQDLQARALAEIREQPGCSNVRNIVINRVADERAENNWSMCVLSAGAADVNTAASRTLRPKPGAGPLKKLRQQLTKKENSRPPRVSIHENSQRMGIPEIYSAKKDARSSLQTMHSVPELTRSADIKLNTRVSLPMHTKPIA